MMEPNPYASALDGLDLRDPVAGFFAFCRERERVRARRESGAPPPWTDDPVLRRGRFLNVFREDDRATKAILRFVAPAAAGGDALELVRAVFFARWCNRAETLDALGSPAALLAGPAALSRALDALPDPPWCNHTAYPVVPLRWRGAEYHRREAAVTALAEAAPFLVDAIRGAGGDVARATAAVNAAFRMSNDFPIFMAVMDVAWFRPDLVSPASPVPVGIGAVAFLDRLQSRLGCGSYDETFARMIELQPRHWPEAKRRFHPVDIEYLCCECRKYYSYVNGTKQYEGKNAFVPGKTPRLLFDVPAAATARAQATGICVIAGGPCSGKSTLCAALRGAGRRVEPELAEQLLRAGVAAGRTAEEMRRDPVAWQQGLLAREFELFDGLAGAGPVFTDTSFVETVVFSERAGIEIGPGLDSWIRRKRYRTVFFLAPLDAYEETAVRMEGAEAAARISADVRAAYRRYGYELVTVPRMPVAARLAFVVAAAGGAPAPATAANAFGLHRVPNFRGLGAAAGVVAPRRIFRTGTLDWATDADARAILGGLGVRTYVDLRSPPAGAGFARGAAARAARAAGDALRRVSVDLHASLWPLEDISPATRRLPGVAEFAAHVRRTEAAHGVPPAMASDADLVRGLLGYSILILRHNGARVRAALAPFTRAGNYPIAFGCHTGKDRTGVVAALLLGMLGAPRRAIVADYELSNAAVDHHAAVDAHRAAHAGAAAPPAPGTDEQRRRSLGVRAAVMEGVLDWVAEHHGSVLGYLGSIGFTEADVAAVRAAAAPGAADAKSRL